MKTKTIFATAVGLGMFAASASFAAGDARPLVPADVYTGGKYDRAPAAAPAPAPRGVCYPVLGTLSSNKGEVLYYTGSPALGNCATPVIDGPAKKDRPEKPDDDCEWEGPKGGKGGHKGGDWRSDKGKDRGGWNGRDRDRKGNASANNRRGGNYDRTGHRDNGRGKGRDS